MPGPELTEEQKRQQFEAACEAKPLKDQLPSLRAIEGFPIGKDEDILALSETPYYTACPNPYINDFIEAFGKSYDPATDDYEQTPFVSDIHEGKNEPIYNAHSYHTKVPYKAIIPFIEHYTQKGDLIFDGFCGTGMTGVAAGILKRKAILGDLSPAATYIASAYCLTHDLNEFSKLATDVLHKIEKECGWLYETNHIDGKTKGRINYIVWSDALLCPYCKNEYIFYDVAVDEEESKVLDDFPCPHCNSTISKKSSEKVFITFYDEILSRDVTQIKQIPVRINYNIERKRYTKKIDTNDLQLIEKINRTPIPFWFPHDRMPEGDESRRNDKIGLTNVHHFYTKRNLWVLACMAEYTRGTSLFIVFQSVNFGLPSKFTRYNLGNRGNGPVSGTLYVPSLTAENNCIQLLKGKIDDFKKVLTLRNHDTLVSCGSTTELQILSNSIDYIFTDPPFGSNLMYSELNFIWETWLKVITNISDEALINKVQRKELVEYRELMTSCFKEMNRILKPNRWITVEFHNSKASVWNSIQDSLTKSGFIIAQVSVLDKKQGSFKQVTSAGAVKNDLVINAYKPRQQFEERFLKRAGLDLEKDFVYEHLSHLPIEPNIERTEQMLFSKMLAHYIQHGYEIRLNARQFYNLLRDHFKLIDGYWFLDNEITKYEEWKKANGLQAIDAIAKGQQTLFVTDERSFLIWLYNYLSSPKTYSDIFTASRNILSSSSMIEDQIPEPKQLLETNFIYEDGKYRRPTTDTEREGIEFRREKELQKSFEKILELALTGTKKIKDVRKEAVAYGFTKAYQEKRFTDIITVAKKLDKEILETNSEINDFVDIAQLKVGEGI